MAQIVSIAGSVEPDATAVTRPMPAQEASGSDFGGQIGQSLQGLGQQIGQAAQVYAQDMHQRQQFTTEARWSDWQSDQQADFDKASEGISGTNAMGFTAQRAQQSDAAFKDFLSSVPVNDQPRMQAKYADYKRVMSHQALVTELQTADKFYGQQISDKLDKFSTGIAQNPATAQTYLDQGAAFIDASGLPAGVKDQLKKDWVQGAAAAKANGLLNTDPQALKDTLSSNGNSSPEDFVKRMTTSESSGDYAAHVVDKNGIGHSGLLQLSDDWVKKAGDAGVIPKGMTPQQFMADHAAQDKANVWYLGQVDKYIADHGYTDRGYSLDGLRAVAHLGGLGGLDRFVASGGQYNPNDGKDGKVGTSLSDYYNKFSGTAHDPILSNLSYADTLKFRDQATAQLRQNAQAAAAQQRVAHDTLMNGLGAEADNGQMSIERVNELWRTGVITDIDDRTKLEGLIRAGEERQKSLDHAQEILQHNGKIDALVERAHQGQLSSDEIDTLYTRGVVTDRQDLSAIRSAAAAQDSVTHNNMMNKLGIMANSGQMSMEQIDALTQNGTLKDIDDATKLQGLVKSYAERQGGINLAQAIISNQGPVNGQDADVQKAGNAWASRKGATFEDGIAFYNRSGYLPDKTSNALFGMTLSTDPKIVQQGAAVLGNILAQNPNGLAGANHSAELVKTGSAFNTFVNDLGMAPEMAAQKIAQMNDPATHTDVQDKQVQTFSDKLFKDTPAILDRITGAFNGSTFGLGKNPLAGVDNRQIGRLSQDYIDLATERYRETGDETVAKAYAMDVIHGKDGKPGLYGLSNGVLTKYPVEAASLPMPDGTHDYVYRQAAAEVKARNNVDVDPKNIVLVPLPGNVTGELWRRGGTSVVSKDRTEAVSGVPYQIVFKNADGVYEPLAVAAGKGFIPDAKQGYAEYLATEREKNAVDVWNKYQAQKAAFEARAAGSAGRAATAPLPVMDAPPKPASILAKEKADAAFQKTVTDAQTPDPVAAAKSEQNWLSGGPGTEFFGTPIPGGN